MEMDQYRWKRTNRGEVEHLVVFDDEGTRVWTSTFKHPEILAKLQQNLRGMVLLAKPYGC